MFFILGMECTHLHVFIPHPSVITAPLAYIATLIPTFVCHRRNLHQKWYFTIYSQQMSQFIRHPNLVLNIP